MKVRLKHDRLAEALGRSRLSQNRWAIRLGLGRGHLSNLVNGRHPYPRAETRERLLKGTGLKFEDLFIIETPTTRRTYAADRRSSGARERRAIARLTEPDSGTASALRGLPGSAAGSGGNWMSNWLQDVRYGLRILRRSPGFTIVAVLALAIGIGANSAIFSAVNGILLRPFPYQDPQRIITLWQIDNNQGALKEDVSSANFSDWREQSLLLNPMSAVAPYSYDYTGTGEPETFFAANVTRDFFKIFGVEALHGRTFLEEEYEPGRDKVLILSYSIWTRRFGRDPKIVSQSIRLDDEEYSIVGVMPHSFRPRLFEKERELWVPRALTANDLRRRASNYWKAVARLNGEATLEQAQAEADSIAARLAREYPRTNAGSAILLQPFPEHKVGNVRPALLVMLTAVGLVLLIACANVANLILARHNSRRTGLAVRSALGAGRLRLLRQLLTESAILGLAGGLIGLGMAFWGVQIIRRLGPEDLPRLDQIGLDASVVIFTLVVSLLTSLIFGAGPSLRFSNPDLRATFAEGGATATTGRSRLRVQNLLVVSEVAMAVVLLVCAGLSIKSFAALLSVDPGFAVEEVNALQVFVYDQYSTPASRSQFFVEALERIEALPGVISAGAVLDLPLSDGTLAYHDINVSFLIGNRPPPEPGQEPVAHMNFVTGRYFETMGIPLKKGRFFARTDHAQAAPVVLINETMAKRYWPDEDPVGRKIAVRYSGVVEREIVGIVGDSRHDGMDSDPSPEFFLHHPQVPFGSMTFVTRTATDASMALGTVKSEIWKLNPQLPFYETTTMERLFSDSLVPWRFNLALLTAFAAMALLLTAIGIYGVISFATRQRSNEIGLRMALGAGAHDIRRMIVGQGVVLAALGIVIGLGAALLMTRFLTSMLYSVTPTDPTTFAGIALILLAVAWLASYVPALRATRVDPMEALRYE